MLFSGASRRLEYRAGFYRQWASMLEAGVPMVRTLHTLARSASLPRDRKVLRKLANAIERGGTLSDGLQQAGRWASPLDRALIDIGERTGRLETSLNLLAESAGDQAKLLREIGAGAAYPILVLHVALLVFPVSLIRDLVLEADIFPFILQKIRVFAVLYGALFGLRILAASSPGRQLRALSERLLGLVPALGPGRRDLALARLAMALDAQLAAGIGVIEAWSLAGKVCGSPALHREIRTWQAPLERGATPGELVAASHAFGGLFAEYYQTGETSGKLDEALARIQRHYQEIGKGRLRAFAEWMPRLIYMAVLLYVAFKIISFWSGYYGQFEL